MLLPLLKAALKFVPEDDEENFADHRAPRDSDLPIIMTLCEPDERDAIIKVVKDQIVDGEWTGPLTGRKGSKRPTVRFVPRAGYEDQRQGRRKSTYLDKRNGKEYSTKPVSTFIAAHAILIDAGKYPSEQKNTASHLCHESLCLESSHLVWESHDANQKRERKCHQKGECHCGQQPSCLFDVHK